MLKFILEVLRLNVKPPSPILTSFESLEEVIQLFGGQKRFCCRVD